MSMLEQFQKLDDLIIEHTGPPIQVILRNQLALTHEQVEAHQDSSDAQDRTLQAQLERISDLEEQVKKRDAMIARLQASNEKPSIEVINPLGPPTYSGD
jgi:hypothetical protein